MRRKVALVVASAIALVIMLAVLIPILGKVVTDANLPHGQGINTVAVLGDSASTAMNSCGEQLLCYDNSWASGSSKTVDSITTRLAKAEGHKVAAFNYAYPGDRLQDLAPQAKQAVAQHVDAILLLIGANDFCQPAVSQMTSSAKYAQEMKILLTDLHGALPDAKIFVASVQDPAKEYKVGSVDPKIVNYWSTHDLCLSLLKNPTAKSAAAVARRNTVYQRAISYNKTLASLCTSQLNCHYDGGALYNLQFTAGQLSSVDHFHPSVSGQAAMAATEWQAAKSFLLSSD